MTIIGCQQTTKLSSSNWGQSQDWVILFLFMFLNVGIPPGMLVYLILFSNFQYNLVLNNMIYWWIRSPVFTSVLVGVEPSSFFGSFYATLPRTYIFLTISAIPIFFSTIASCSSKSDNRKRRKNRWDLNPGPWTPCACTNSRPRRPQKTGLFD